MMSLKIQPFPGVRYFVFIAGALSLWMAMMLSARAATYYVDSAGGNDANSGTATNAAWQTLAKVNTPTFLPGDSILFKAGGSWNGTTQLHPKGSGAAGNPIVIDLYGTGPKPVINAGSATGNGAVYLSNQSYWEINNLEITSDANSDGDRRGVYFQASSGTINHLYLRNCYIHNIRGTFASTDGGSTSPGKRTGGMVVEDTGSTSFNDILIENNEIQTVRNEGLVACLNASSAKYVIIRGNVIHDVTKNGMVIRVCDSTCLIEHNLCYNTANQTTGNTMFTAGVNGPVFQYNEGYANLAGDHDGSMYDADLSSKNVVFQYSYSHDNSHGLYWQYGASSSDTGNICRYNISQNDQGNIFSLSGSGGSDYFYNNTIYIPPTNKPPTNLPRYIIDDRSSGHTEYFYNNIIYNLSPSAQYHLTSGNTHAFNYNVFYGNHPSSEPADANKLTSDPLLVAPGTGSNGGTGTNSVYTDLASLGGYQLQAGSPCIDSGLTIANNGGLDFFSNSVPFNGVADRGAYEWHGAVNPNPPPLIITQPVNQEVCAGSSASFSVVATNSPQSYQWFKGGNSLAGQNNSTLVLGSVTTNDAANYSVVITNLYGSATSAVAALTVDIGSPVISSQPTNQIVSAGSSVDFTVTATGGLSLTYQWRKDGSQIAGANASGYSIASVSTNDMAGYDVIVANSCGSVTSLVATLTINTNVPPSISVQPPDLTACYGNPAGFTVTAGGSPPLNYQWRKAGVNLSGITNTSLDFGGVTTNDAAGYDVVIANSFGSVTSRVAILTVDLPPTITLQPTNQTVNAGANVSFSVTAAGTTPFSYQWRTNGGAVASGTNSTYSFNSVTTANAANYDVVVANGCGSVTSSVAILTVNAVISSGTNTLNASSRATVRDGVNFSVDIDEQTAGYVMVKYSTAGSAAKGYFQFDLTGQSPDPAVPATFRFFTTSSSGAQRIQLWALNQSYPGMANTITWATAQANETNTDNLLTNGAYTATMIGANVLMGTGTTSNSFTLPAPWGQYIQGNKLVLVFTAVTDASDSSSGCRIVVTNAATLPALTYSIVSSQPPTPTTLAATGVNAGAATVNGTVNPSSLPTTWYFQYGTNISYGSYTITNSLAAGASAVGVSNALSNFSSGTVYHYQLVAVNSGGSSNGGDATFNTLAVTAPRLTGLQIQGNGVFQFSFTNTPGASFTVLGTTNIASPLNNWTVLGVATESPAGHYNFSDPQATNNARRFYEVRSP